MAREWLKKAREDKGISALQMSEDCGLSYSYYARIEQGERQKNMELRLAAKIGNALGMTIQEIREKEEAWLASM